MIKREGEGRKEERREKETLTFTKGRGRRMRECENEGAGGKRSRPKRNGCHCCEYVIEERMLSLEMPSQVERREKGGVTIERREMKISLKILLYFTE